MTQLVTGGMDADDLATLERHVWTARVTGTAPDPEAMNIVSAHWHAQDRDTPAKTWSTAIENHPAIYRALQIDPADPSSRFATGAFRLWQSPEGAWLVLAAHPAPRMCGPVDLDHLGINTVLAWNPKTGDASILSDPAPQLFGAFTDQAKGMLFANPRAYLRAWAEQRARFFVQCQSSAGKEWAVRPVEYDLAPGALMVGAVDDIRWNPATLPAEVQCVGVAPAKINKAIFKAARLPFVTGSEGLRVAA